MSNGTDIAAEVKAALAEAGVATGDGPQVFTLTRPGALDESTYPPTHGQPQTYSFTGVIDTYSDRDRAGTNIQEGEVMLMLDAGETEILGNDSLVCNGRTYHIAGIDALRPGGVVLMWKIRASAP